MDRVAWLEECGGLQTWWVRCSDGVARCVGNNYEIVDSAAAIVEGARLTAYVQETAAREGAARARLVARGAREYDVQIARSRPRDVDAATWPDAAKVAYVLEPRRRRGLYVVADWESLA